MVKYLDFVDIPEDMQFLMIGFSPASIPLKKRWKTNGLSADFIGDFLQNFFVNVGYMSPEEAPPIPVHSKNAAKYVANELLENAMKFHDASQSRQTKISFNLDSNRIIFHSINTAGRESTNSLKQYIEKLGTYDPNEFYMLQMEANALDENNHSGLGFLSMICDYGAKVGWKIEQPDLGEPYFVITTSVTLPI